MTVSQIPNDDNRSPSPHRETATAKEGSVGGHGAPPPMLEVDGVARSFGNTQALREVSLSIAPGEIHGLCGQNGAGKSTLVKIISGQLQPDRGVLRFDGDEVHFTRPRDAQDRGIAIVDQELSIVGALSVEENVLLGGLSQGLLTRHKRTRPHVRALLERVGLGDLSPQTPAESLSMAQRQLLEIARLLGRDARLLILDEPTASLSRGDSLIVFAALRELASQGQSVLYVSHRLDEVLDLCHRITILRDGRLVANESADKLDHASLVSHIIGAQHSLEISREQARAAIDPAEAGPTGAEIKVSGLRVRDRVDGISLELRPGEIVGLAGQVGSGASEVLRALAGLEPDASGHLTVGGTRVRLGSPMRAASSGITFVSNDRKNEGLFLTRSIEHNLLATRLSTVSRAGILRTTDVHRRAEALVEHVALKSPGLSATVAQLSGGNQQKVFIGRSLGRIPNHLLLLDEPTRGVDVRGRADIHNLVRQAAAEDTAVLFVSGEPDEILQLADRIICMQGGEIVSEHRAADMTEELLLAETTRSREPSHVD